ncbi:MAG TPA: TIR domain-containing protein [Xanthobacteraceae bacterium]|nr:TIR domain-containing protein [Xanthobacteraceae bacterium]
MFWGFLRRSPAIFISYRHVDAPGTAAHVIDRIIQAFGKSSVFLDDETIPGGADFPDRIRVALKHCKIVVAIVGPHWAGADALHRLGIFDRDDWIRIEIETALKSKVPIIPVTIDQAKMPTAGSLPESLLPFSYRHAIDIGSERRHLDRDLEHLTREIGALIKRKTRFIWYGSAAAIGSLLLFFAWVVFFAPMLSAPPAPTEAQAVEACNRSLALSCAQAGGAFGSPEAIEGLKTCKAAQVVPSDRPSLQWKDIWTTSVYSFGPGGGGPGGGKDDEFLKVGGWGDWYFSLIRFDLTRLARKPRYAAIALYARPYDRPSVELFVDKITAPWDFPKGGTLWWRDRPAGQAAGSNLWYVDPSEERLPAPRTKQWYIIELTALVHEWLDRKSENYGFQIRSVNNSGNFVFFASSDDPDKSKIPRLIFCD